MSSMNLFEETPYEIKLASDRTEPAVWVRRLQLVEDLTGTSKPIQDIEFRRGLNIICTERAGPQDRRVVGHSVGKTLLSRLIRYCLGEHAFGTRAVRNAIAVALENGHVLAEIHVLGQPWVVARPIGLDFGRSSGWARAGSDISALLTGPAGAVKFSDFVSAIEQATTGEFAGVILPHAERLANWLDLLAWMSRDQECRFRHQSEWRDPDSESRTTQLQIEDASMVMRMAMDLLSDQEKTLQVAHRTLLADRKSLASEVTRLESHLDAEEDSLRRILKIDANIRAGELFGAGAVDAAVAKQKQLDGLLKEREADKSVGEADIKRLELVTKVATIQEQTTETQGKHDAERTLLSQLEQADTNTYYASFSVLGQRWCRLFQTEGEATQKGCPGKPTNAVRAGDKDPEQAQRIIDGREHIKSLTQRLTQLGVDLKAETDKRDKAQRAYDSALDQRTKALGDIRQRIGNWQEVEQRANSYIEKLKSLTRKKDNTEAFDKKIEKSNEAQRAARDSLESKRLLLSGHFDYVLKKLIGPEAGGEVVLEARGVVPQPNGSVAASGQALSTSAMVLGFDFACIIGYITGIGFLPGFFLHDSPREADMEDALYHRLFDLAASLEGLFGSREPSFQYIVATTTPPPDNLNRAPFIRLRLDAREENGLLLRRRLAVR